MTRSRSRRPNPHVDPARSQSRPLVLRREVIVPMRPDDRARWYAAVAAGLVLLAGMIDALI